MPDLYRLARPILWNLPPELAHSLALWTLRAGLGRLVASEKARKPDPPILAQSVWGLRFRNPIGLAAGFDKDAYAAAEILGLGFGCVEVGTVTPRPQAGNAKPRLFRLNKDQAIINSMGFPSEGLDAVLARVAAMRSREGVLGISVGKNRNNEDAFADYVEGVRRAAPFADYLVVNVSSPNTPGLRDLQYRSNLEGLLQKMLEAREKAGVRPPLLVKIAPDLAAGERADIAGVVLASGIEGIVIANTTVTRPPGLKDPHAGEAGGLSGKPLFDLSTELLAEMYRLTSGRVTLVGVGGISGPEDAYAKIRAGATLVQLHTAFIFSGMNLLTEIKAGVANLVFADGFTNIADAVGADHRGGSTPRCSGRFTETGMTAPHPPADAGPSLSPHLRGEGRGEGQFTLRRKRA